MSKQKETAKCPRCGETFTKRRPWQEFCTPACRMEMWKEGHVLVSRKDWEAFQAWLREEKPS